MNRFRKIVSLLLSMCLLASVLTGLASAVSGSNVSFTGLPASSVEVGDTVTVTITHKAANLVAAGLYLEFDKTKLECTGITAADGTEGLGMYYTGSKGTTWADATVADTVADTNKDGIFSLGVAGAVNGSDFTEQVVAIITFKAIASGEAEFILNENSSGTNDFKGVAQTATLSIDSPISGGTNVSFTGLPASSVEVGDTVTVTITHKAANLVAAGLYLEFDKTKLECTGITAADGTEGLGMYYTGSKGTTWADATVADTVADTNKDGIFSLGVAGAVNGSDFTEQVVAIITFKAIASGEAVFILNENSSGTDDFKGVAQTATLSIEPGPTAIIVTVSDITIEDAGKYTGSPLTPAVTVAGLSHSDFTVSYSNNINAGSNASVTVSPVANGRYTFTPVTKNFTIDKAEQTIDADDITAVVGAGEVTFDFRAEGNIGISIDGTIPTGTAVDLQAKKMTVGNTAGTFKLILNASETDNYNAATKQITVTISAKTDANVTFSNASTSKTYGDAAFNLNASASKTGNNGTWKWTSSNTDVLTVNSAGKVTVVGAGKATITAKYESDTTIGSATVEITVEKASQSITGSHITIETGKNVDLSRVFSAKGTLSYSISDGATVSGNILTAGNTPGTYDLTVSAAETANYKAATKGFTVTVKAEESDDPIVPPIVTKHTLSFDTNGGSAIASVTKIALSRVDLSSYVTTKPGYEFAGWYTDKALTNKVTTIRLSRNMTVYAKWVEVLVVDKPCDGGEDCLTYGFADVDKTQWYHASVDFAVATGLMNGIGSSKFDPHGATTRAMFVTMLYRLEGKPVVTEDNPFSDVEEGTWYTEAIIWAAANGVVDGYGEGLFGPEDEVTREQMAKIMYNYAKYKGYDISARASLAAFNDADEVSSWATEEMQWAVAVGLIEGMGDGTVAPQDDAERCQVAAIFMRFYKEFLM